MKLINAISLNMLSHIDDCLLKIKEIEKPDLTKLKSCIGHSGLASVLGVEVNRTNVKLKHGEKVVVAQYIGERLPEGCKELPEGATIKFLEVTYLLV
jgi:anthranilate/para-aminobenzoate synthase component II